MYISLDNIPDKTSDSLIIEGRDSSGSLMYRSSLWLIYSATNDTAISSDFYRITTDVYLLKSRQQLSGMAESWNCKKINNRQLTCQ